MATIAEIAEYIQNDRIAALKETLTQRMNYMEAFAAEQREADQKALVLYTTEKDRRLHDLNGEAGRLRDMQSSYLPREVWEQSRREMDREIAQLKEGAATLAGRAQIVSVGVSGAVSLVVAIVARYFFR